MRHRNTWNILAGLLFAVCFICTPVTAHGAQIGFVKSNIWTSKTSAIVGENITIFAILANSEANDLEGQLVFLNNSTGETVGSAKSFTLPGGGSSSVISVVWKAVKGDHRFRAKIINAVGIDRTGVRTPLGSEILSELSDAISVQEDSDHDGVPNDQEAHDGTNPNNPDTDGDSLNDKADPNPLKKDTDSDGDPDGTDPAPTNPSVFTPPDTDHDGIPDSRDSDMDNDGLYNWTEKEIGTNPLKYDTDGDGYGDKQDAYPLDPKRWKKETETLQLSELAQEPEMSTTTEMMSTSSITPTPEFAEVVGMVLGEKVGQTASENSAGIPLLKAWWFQVLALLWLALLALLIYLYYKKRTLEERVENDE